MRSKKISELISWAWQRMLDILFRPFNFKKWLVLIWIAFLAGALGTGNGGNGSGSRRQENNSSQKQESSLNQNQARDFSARQAEMQKSKTTAEAVSQPESVQKSGPAASQEPANPRRLPFLKWILIGVGALILALIVFFCWLHGRFEFVWLNALIENKTEIKIPLKEYEPQGRSLFRANLAISGAGLAAIASLGAIGFLLLRGSGVFQKGNNVPWLEVLGKIAPLLLISIPVFIIFSLVSALVSFATPLMRRYLISFIPAFQKAWQLFTSNPGDFLIFWIMNFFLGIAAMILQFTAILAFMLLGLIVFGALFFVFLFVVKSKAVAAILVAVPAVVLFILAMTMIQLPSVVFFRLFSLAYLSSHGEEYEVVK